jgi:hypothetical protein
MRMGRSPLTNPFSPGWGKPPIWAGRRSIVDEFVDVIVPRVRAGVKEAPRLVQAERGMGKTALLEVIAEETRELGGHIVQVTGVAGEHAARILARRLTTVLSELDAVGRLTDGVRAALGHLAAVRTGPFALEFHPGEQALGVDSADLAAAIVAAATGARERGSVLVFGIDEVQNIDGPHLAAIFTALQDAMSATLVAQAHPSGGLVRVHLPIVVWAAGLPSSLARFKKIGSTFGERCELLALGPLTDADIREVCLTFAEHNSEGVAFDGPAIDAFNEAVGGYPYAFQLIGKAAWNAGESHLISSGEVEAGVAAVEPQMRARYAARLSALTDDQRRYLVTLAGLAPDDRTPTNACRAYRGDPTATAAQCGSHVQRLVEFHQILRSDRNGRLTFTLRGMDSYLRSLTT